MRRRKATEYQHVLNVLLGHNSSEALAAQGAQGCRGTRQAASCGVQFLPQAEVQGPWDHRVQLPQRQGVQGYGVQISAFEISHLQVQVHVDLWDHPLPQEADVEGVACHTRHLVFFKAVLNPACVNTGSDVRMEGMQRQEGGVLAV